MKRSAETPRAEVSRDARAFCEKLLGRDWLLHIAQGLRRMGRDALGGLGFCYTADQALERAEQILATIPEQDRSLARSVINDLVREGTWVVLLPRVAPEGHTFLQLMGARHCNVGNMHLFALPRDFYNIILIYLFPVRTNEEAYRRLLMFLYNGDTQHVEEILRRESDTRSHVESVLKDPHPRQ